MLIQILVLILGLILLLKGASWLVDGGSAVASRLKISRLAIGLTVVAFGTSAPELVVNVMASISGSDEIVFGNVIGSNNFNLFIILGITGLISPLVVQSTTVWKEIPISLVAALLLLVLANLAFTDHLLTLDRVEGFILLFGFFGFLFYVYSQLKKEDEEQDEENIKIVSQKKAWIYIILGLTMLVIGGRLVVINAVSIASALGVSEKIIGLTIVAAGTSMPELATSLVAVLKKNNDIAVGNIVGSNIFNILFILAASSIISPIQYNIVFNTDIYLLIGGTVFLFLAMFTGQKGKLDRWEGAILLISYIVYTAYIIYKETN